MSAVALPLRLPLREGSLVDVRRIEPNDKLLLRDGLERLSEEPEFSQTVAPD